MVCRGRHIPLSPPRLQVWWDSWCSPHRSLSLGSNMGSLRNKAEVIYTMCRWRDCTFQLRSYNFTWPLLFILKIKHHIRSNSFLNLELLISQRCTIVLLDQFLRNKTNTKKLSIIFRSTHSPWQTGSSLEKTDPDTQVIVDASDIT